MLQYIFKSINLERFHLYIFDSSLAQTEENYFPSQFTTQKLYNSSCLFYLQVVDF